ncbi:DNA polymerase III subunit gamma/tau [candidate division WWE3 bacterium]|uniref:DNA polymerase III subunit gamma/tau n=1 Tax=candidate division WWE3 bacterium TaxID=2053526 RepID=A0A955LG32_UNCKA|nr:DNA polymerase III subunit gamma/tau [candidate division WWE3 bacterium]
MSLYRKYRPKNFSEVLGQEHVTQTLQNAIAHDMVSHAYLFSGPRGTGKTSIARILAQQLGCGELDIIEIDAASHRGIDEVRALREQAQYQPTSGEKKIYILDEVHMLTKEAFNALLKIIEEPPTYVHFVLCTTEPHKVPVTIISRTQRFDFRPGTTDNLSQLLDMYAQNEGVVLAPEARDLIAEYADGGYRDAASFLEQVIQSANSEAIDEGMVRNVLGLVDTVDATDLITATLERDLQHVLDILEKLEKKQVNTHYLGSLLLKKLRVLLRENADFAEKIRDISSLVAVLTEALRLVKYSPVPMIPIESALLTWMSESVTKPTPIVQKENPKKSTAQPSAKDESMQADVDNESTQTPVEKTVEVNESEPVTVTISGPIMESWDQIMQAIKPYNHTLEALLKACEPHSLEENTLTLNFKYKFHKERIEEPENKRIVEEVIEKVTGQKVTISCVLKVQENTAHRSFHGHDAVEVDESDRPPVQPQKNGSHYRKNTDTMAGAKESPVDLAMKELEGVLIQSD